MATLNERPDLIVDDAPFADTPAQVLVLCRRIVEALADAGLIDAAHVFVPNALTPLRVTVRCYTAQAGLQPPVYTDPALGSSITIKAVHITQLRAAVIAIDTPCRSRLWERDRRT